MKALQAQWSTLHTQPRFLPRYPSEEVARFAFRHLARLGEARGGTAVLDLGCGGGRHALFLSREGFRAFAVDFSRPGVAETRERLGREGLATRAAQADAGRLPFRDESFHGIVAYGSLYYTDWEGMNRFVSEMRRVLRTGGVAFVQTRTTRDCRFGQGREAGRSTYVLTTEQTNEAGMPNCFLSEDDVAELFRSFRDVSLDLAEFTVNNRQLRNSDWLITATK